MLNILNEVNDFLWTYIVITLLVICAVYFTIKTKGVQFRSLKETWNLLKEKPKRAAAVKATLMAVTFPVPKSFVILSERRLEVMVPTQIIMEIIPA